MNKIAPILLAVLGLLAAPQAIAQYQLTSALGGTNQVEAESTGQFAVILPAVRSPQIAIQPTLRLTGAGSDPVVFTFDFSTDFAHWEPEVFSFEVTPDGTNSVTAITNLTVGAIGWLRLSSIENPNETAVTNLTLKSAMKRPQ